MTQKSAIVVAILLASACSSGGSHAARNATGAAGHRSSSTTSTTGRARASHVATTVGLYFADRSHLAAFARPMHDPTIANAIAALLAGPTAADRSLGAQSLIPAGTRLLGVQLAGTTATVRVSPDFEASSAPEDADRLRVAEVVFTATQFPQIHAVVLASENNAAGTIGPPLTRQDLTDVLDTVLTDTPVAGETVTSPLHVSGMSDTFEGHVSLRLRDAHGRVLADTSTDATSGNGVWGTFAADVPFSKPATATGTLEVFDASQGDSAAAYGQTIAVHFG